METPESTVPPPQGKNLLDQGLSLFSVVKGGEGGNAILLTLNVFLLPAAYYFLKIVRDTLILDESGAAAASYSAAGHALLLLLVVFVGIQRGFGIHNFAVANTIFCLMWLGVAVVIFREHKRITKES